MSKFKAGDKVRVLPFFQRGHERQNLNTGDIFTVLGTATTRAGEPDDCINAVGFRGGIWMDNVEIIERTTTPAITRETLIESARSMENAWGYNVALFLADVLGEDADDLQREVMAKPEPALAERIAETAAAQVAINEMPLKDAIIFAVNVHMGEEN